MELKIVKPFGPSVMQSQIPEKLINDLNDYVDEIIKDQEKSNKLDFGNKLAGDVTQEFRLEKDFAKNVGWIDYLAKCVYSWIEKELNLKITSNEKKKTRKKKNFT